MDRKEEERAHFCLLSNLVWVFPSLALGGPRWSTPDVCAPPLHEDPGPGAELSGCTLSLRDSNVPSPMWYLPAGWHVRELKSCSPGVGKEWTQEKKGFGERSRGSSPVLPISHQPEAPGSLSCTLGLERGAGGGCRRPCPGSHRGPLIGVDVLLGRCLVHGACPPLNSRNSASKSLPRKLGHQLHFGCPEAPLCISRKGPLQKILHLGMGTFNGMLKTSGDHTTWNAQGTNFHQRSFYRHDDVTRQKTGNRKGVLIIHITTRIW